VNEKGIKKKKNLIVQHAEQLKKTQEMLIVMPAKETKLRKKVSKRGEGLKIQMAEKQLVLNADAKKKRVIYRSLIAENASWMKEKETGLIEMQTKFTKKPFENLLIEKLGKGFLLNNLAKFAVQKKK